MNLTTKIMIVIILLAGALMAAMGFLVYSSTKSAVQDSISQNQLQTAQSAMQTIDRVLYERYLDIQDFAGSVIIRKYLTGSATKEEVQQRLDSFFATSGPWDALEIWSADEKLIFSSEKGWQAGDNTHSTDEKSMFEAALKGQVYVSDVITSADFGKPTVYFSAPIRDDSVASHPIMAVAMGQFSWPVIEGIVANTAGKTTHVHLFAKNELMIATNGDRKDLFNETAKYLHTAGIEEDKIQSAIIKSNEGTFEVLASQAPQLGYLGYKGSGWELLMETPTSIAFAPANAGAIKIMMWLVTFIIVAVVILLLILYLLIIKPVRELTATAKAISKGDLIKRAQIISKDEVGILASSFNQMTDDILKKTEELEAQNEELETTSAELEESKTGLEGAVAERTAELEKAKNGLESEVQQRTVELQKVNEELNQQKLGLEQEVTKRTQELRGKLLELERFNKISVGRELKMVELKKEIARLKESIVQP